jgi:hypothetical protein
MTPWKVGELCDKLDPFQFISGKNSKNKTPFLQE